MERLYMVHHRGSRWRGRTVRLLSRPRSMPPGPIVGQAWPPLREKSLFRAPNNVLAELTDGAGAGERFVCPFRGLRSKKTSGRC